MQAVQPVAQPQHQDNRPPEDKSWSEIFQVFSRNPVEGGKEFSLKASYSGFWKRMAYIVFGVPAVFAVLAIAAPFAAILYPIMAYRYFRQPGAVQRFPLELRLRSLNEKLTLMLVTELGQAIDEGQTVVEPTQLIRDTSSRGAEDLTEEIRLLKERITQFTPTDDLINALLKPLERQRQEMTFQQRIANPLPSRDDIEARHLENHRANQAQNPLKRSWAWPILAALGALIATPIMLGLIAVLVVIGIPLMLLGRKFTMGIHATAISVLQAGVALVNYPHTVYQRARAGHRFPLSWRHHSGAERNARTAKRSALWAVGAVCLTPFAIIAYALSAVASLLIGAVAFVADFIKSSFSVLGLVVLSNVIGFTLGKPSAAASSVGASNPNLLAAGALGQGLHPQPSVPMNVSPDLNSANECQGPGAVSSV